MSTDTKSPMPEKPEQQPTAPQNGELDAEQLDQVSGGNLGSAAAPVPPPPPPLI